MATQFTTPENAPTQPPPQGTNERLRTVTPTGYHRVQPNRTVELNEFDKAYVDKLAAGDSETTEHFAKRFYTILVVKLRAKMRSSNQAEDMAQETLYRVLKTLKSAGGIEHPERLAAYVRGVSENVLLETIRQGGRFQQVPENTPEPVERALDAERSYISNERKENMRLELKKLGQKDQKLLKKVFLEEQDKDEICAELQIDRNYLRVQVHRALARFRVILSKSPAKNSGKKPGDKTKTVRKGETIPG